MTALPCSSVALEGALPPGPLFGWAPPSQPSPRRSVRRMHPENRSRCPISRPTLTHFPEFPTHRDEVKRRPVYVHSVVQWLLH